MNIIRTIVACVFEFFAIVLVAGFASLDKENTTPSAVGIFLLFSFACYVIGRVAGTLE